MARGALWWSSDGSLMVDLDAVVCAEWKPADEDRDGPELELTFRGDTAVVNNIGEDLGNEVMAALRRHAQWPDGTPYRG